MVEKWRSALGKYVDLGETALAALERGDWESCEYHLGERQKVFCNFQALDHLVMSQGVDMSKDRSAALTLSQALELHEVLTRALNDAAGLIEGSLRKINQARGVADAYRSGLTVPRGLQKRA